MILGPISLSFSVDDKGMINVDYLYKLGVREVDDRVIFRKEMLLILYDDCIHAEARADSRATVHVENHPHVLRSPGKYY
jgi:hypothetical protein